MSSTNSPGGADEIGPLSRSPTNKSIGTSRPGNILRRATESFSESRLPVGMFAAFGTVGSNIPTLDDIQKGNFESDGWSGPAQRRNSVAHRDSDFQVLNLHRQRTNSLAIGKEEPRKISTINEKAPLDAIDSLPSAQADESATIPLGPRDPSAPYPNGYQFPPKHTKLQATTIALRGFWKFLITPFGFLLTLYALNIVAWGGMLFLILCRATPAMSHPSWTDNSSGAKRWLEIDSQILNALFCVTGLGLIPWRFRDLYYLLQWRWRKNTNGLRRLAGIHRGWFRLQGSQDIDVHFHPAEDEMPAGINESALAIPVSLSPDAPLTGERASPTKYWLLDFVIWTMVWNTFLQIALCGMMWGYNRFNRPSWSVGLLISLACIVASAGGWVMFKQGKRVKKVEGVPVSKEDMELLKEMNAKAQV